MSGRSRLSRWLDAAARVDSVLARGEDAVLAASVLAMAAVSVANVLGRNVLGQSLSWAEELEAVLVLLVTFVGIGRGAREARHIRMSALHDQLRGGARKASMVLSLTLTAVVLGIFTVLAVRYWESVRAIGSVTPALRIPRSWIALVVPAGLLLGAIQYVLAVLRNLSTGGVHVSFVREEGYESAEDVDGPHAC